MRGMIASTSGICPVRIKPRGPLVINFGPGLLSANPTSTATAKYRSPLHHARVFAQLAPDDEYCKENYSATRQLFACLCYSFLYPFSQEKTKTRDFVMRRILSRATMCQLQHERKPVMRLASNRRSICRKIVLKPPGMQSIRDLR